MRVLLLVLTCLLLLTACANLPADPAQMSPEQLKEWAKDKNANIACGVVNSPYGRGVGTYVVLDKAVIFNGTIAVDSECKVTISNDSRVPPKEIK